MDSTDCRRPFDRDVLHSPYNECNVSIRDVCDAIEKLEVKPGLEWH